MMKADPVAVMGRDRPAAPLARALALRQRLFHGLVHAGADGLSGVIIDRSGAAAVIQLNAAGPSA